MDTPALEQKARLNLRPFIMLLVLFGIWAIFSFTTDGIFFSSRNFSNLVRQTAITGILATGMVLIIVAGQIDLSIGSLVGLTGGIAAALHVWGPALPAGPAFACALLAGTLLGLFAGWLTAYKNIPAFIVTLGGLMVYRGAIKGVTQGQTIGPFRDDFKFIGAEYLPKWIGLTLMALFCLAILYWVARTLKSGRVGKNAVVSIYLPALFLLAGNVAFFMALNQYEGVPNPVMVLLILAGAVMFLATQTPIGRHIYALGGNKEAAFYSGINIKRHLLFVFTLMGFLSAVAGIIYAARVGSATADAGKSLELDAIAACVIGGTSLMGGRGTIPGALLGALIMASLDNGMSLMNVQDFIQDIIKGAILVVAVFIDVAGKKQN